MEREGKLSESNFDSLVNLHEEIKEFKINKSISILEAFSSRDIQYNSEFLDGSIDINSFKKALDTPKDPIYVELNNLMSKNGKNVGIDECNFIESLNNVLKNEELCDNAILAKNFSMTRSFQKQLDEKYKMCRNRLVLEDNFPEFIFKRMKFKLTKDQGDESRLALSASAICSSAISYYTDLWNENEKDKTILEKRLGPIRGYYMYIIDGLGTFLEESDKNKFESTDEFSLLNIMSLIKGFILDQIRLSDEDKKWEYRRDVVLKIIDKLCLVYDKNKFQFQDNTHPFIHYTFLRILKHWRDEILAQEYKEIYWKDSKLFPDKDNPRNHFDKWTNPKCLDAVIKEIYTIGKYEMYRQLALRNAEDRSLFDVKRLIYSLLIVTLENKYSNDKIKKETIDIIFEEQLETGLWQVGNVVNTDFVIDGGLIDSNPSRIISKNPILSSMECLNDMLLHENISKDLEQEIYQDSLKRTYEWIKRRLREEKASFLLYDEDLMNLEGFKEQLSNNPSINIPEKIKTTIIPLTINEDKRKMQSELREGLNRLILDSELLCNKIDVKKDIPDFLMEFIKKEFPGKDTIYKNELEKKINKNCPDPKELIIRINRLFLEKYFPMNIKHCQNAFLNPIGWYPEYEGTHIPKSWVAGHTLIFLKNYCELVSNLIEKRASLYLEAQNHKELKLSWNELKDTFQIKKYIGKMRKESWTMRKESWTSNYPTYRSAFIFGPPGTGKSTIAKALAKDLEWNYVEITPGQFLQKGEQNIIKTANFIFKRLVHLKKAVIFFDEVDQFVQLRGKNSADSSKWIVTSLLPKFQELRDQKEIIFILATNKIENVDSAMMRSGRIDFVLPMGVICWQERLKILRDTISECDPEVRAKFKELFAGLFSGDSELKTDAQMDEMKIGDIDPKNNDFKELTKYLFVTDFMQWTDIKDLMKNFPKRKGDINDQLLKDDIFFREDSKRFEEYINKEFENFNNYKMIADQKKYFRIPKTMKIEDAEIDDVISNNIFSSLIISINHLKNRNEFIGKFNEKNRETNYDYLYENLSKITRNQLESSRSEIELVKAIIQDINRIIIQEELYKDEKNPLYKKLPNTIKDFIKVKKETIEKLTKEQLPEKNKNSIDQAVMCTIQKDKIRLNRLIIDHNFEEHIVRRYDPEFQSIYKSLK